MLLLSRRENDRIDFLGLGVSIEVVRLTRSRATLAIKAPRHIRVVRHELRPVGNEAAAREAFCAVVRREVMSMIQAEINTTTTKLKLAQEKLLAGDRDDALTALEEAMVRLEVLRSEASSLQSDCFEERCETAFADDWTVAGGVAESSVGYANSSAGEVSDQTGTVWVVHSPDDSPAADWSQAGDALLSDPDAVTVLVLAIG
ncbi:carbon storage regulator [Stieleria sp. ICT_E10.1]|uniref:carbon storage regulator n=1 Tax=Stieleria sedimenti TaxID=2976331 RepID=UPI00217FE1CA|nr:carbon storage regulator [Stieleria sedimenti]MCS7465060.1 carbon storage regulator [Stieleria sedimenti]